jgi:hypothetical protein
MYYKSSKLIFCMLYVVTNRLNGKFYIGVHETPNPHDDYLGSGTSITKAVKKYGRENFYREVVEFYPDSDSAYSAEAEIVTEDLIRHPMCYNNTVGGIGGWSHIDIRGDNHHMRRGGSAKVWESRKKKQNWRESLAETVRRNIKKAHEFNTGKKRPREIVEKIAKSNTGQKRSPESCLKMSIAAKNKPQMSEETRRKISENSKKAVDNGRDMRALSLLGNEKKKTQEFRSRARDHMNERYKKLKESGEKFTCIHCGLQSLVKSNITRWHNDNCRHKKSNENTST